MTPDAADARRAASRACLTVDDDSGAAHAAALGPLAALLAPLREVRPRPGGGAVGVGAGGTPLRADDGPAFAMARSAAQLAPAARGGYVVVPGPDGDTPGDTRGGASSVAGAAVAVDDDALAAAMEPPE